MSRTTSFRDVPGVHGESPMQQQVSVIICDICGDDFLKTQFEGIALHNKQDTHICGSCCTLIENAILEKEAE